MALSFAVLEALSAPASVEALARRLAVPAPHVRVELDRLARRGYVARLEGTSDASLADAGVGCAGAACGGCAFRSACAVVPEVRWVRVATTPVTPPGR